ncbi:hypothetical protein [Acidiplasma sp.]|uniref:SLAC1 family transporter n=1 Tax=Acidiplasma sp. TaxID=1872114 RepID=UPI00258DC175|nr:hypothetical protein [Acidiplasma sp.]
MVSKKFNIPVSAFSSVMGMEISSIAFHFHRLAIISRILEYLGLIVYVFLVLYFVFMLVYHKKILKNITMVPASFTFAAGSSVLGSRLYMGNLIFFSKILLLIAIIFIIYLWFLLLAKTIRKRETPEIYIMFMPFIGVLSLSNLFTHLHGAFNPAISIWVPISLFIIGNLSWIITILSFINYRRYFNYRSLNGFYMIYAGIASLSTVSGTLIIENYGLHGNGLYGLIHGIVIVDYIYSVGLSIFLIIFFILKIIKKSVDLNYKISIWGAVFPFGVLSSATYLTGEYNHINILSPLSLVYASIALSLIIIAIIQIIILLGKGKPDR